jgi:hypothetical protein
VGLRDRRTLGHEIVEDAGGALTVAHALNYAPELSGSIRRSAFRLVEFPSVVGLEHTEGRVAEAIRPRLRGGVEAAHDAAVAALAVGLSPPRQECFCGFRIDARSRPRSVTMYLASMPPRTSGLAFRNLAWNSVMFIHTATP